jgi:hypothetical protein
VAARKAPKEDPVEKHRKVYELLKKVRASKTVTLKPIDMLRKEIVGIDGQIHPFKLRYYQVQAIFHLMSMKRMVLGDATGTGKCVTGDTLVLTDRGLVPIGQLAPQEGLTPDTFYPVNGVRVWTGRAWTPVSKFYWNGPQYTKRVRTREGLEVEGSLNHPVKVRTPEGVEKFKPLDQVGAEDYVCVPRGAPFPLEDPIIPFDPGAENFDVRVVPYPTPRCLTPPLARLLGYIVAEGWSNTKSVIHDDIRQLMLDVFSWSGNGGSKAKDRLILASSQYLRSYLRACGVDESTSHNKAVPWCVSQGTRDSVVQFLRGLFEGEASVDTSAGELDFSTSSETLARGVQILLLNLGIVTSKSPKTTPEYDHTYWRITAFGDEARKFSKEIGFVSQRKQAALDAVLDRESNPNKDMVPHAARLVGDLKTDLLRAVAVRGSNQNRKGSGIKQYGRSFESTLSHVTLGYRDPSFPFLERLLEVSKGAGLESEESYLRVQEVVHNRAFYSPVIEVTDGRAEVMDLEVEHSDHCFWGNGFINHNTLCVIASLCYTWEKEPDNKVIVVATKSAIRQWASEVDKFTTGGITVYIANGSPDERKEVYEQFVKHPTGEGATKAILVMGYAPLVRDWNEGSTRPLNKNGQPDMKAPMTPGLLNSFMSSIGSLTVVFDEAAIFKSERTKTWQVCSELSFMAKRCYGLTATLLKNNLIEGFAIYKCIYPGVFTTKTKFLDLFCHTKMQPVRGGRKIPIITGYKNLELFRMRIDPFYLGRPKHEISDELPKLITKEVKVTLTKAENLKYEEALTGVLCLGDGEVKEYEDNVRLTALIYCQQTVDSLSLLKYEEGDIIEDLHILEENEVKSTGSKEQAMLDLITGEFDGEKVIVYCRFASLIPRLQELCKKEKVKSTAITGKVVDTKKNPARTNAMKKFQDPNSDVRVIFISDAGSESINLQAAAAMIFYNAPWSWGNYVQLLGRPIRIGSPHQHVVAVHLVSERPGRSKKTIDHYTLQILQSKKDLIDKVLGESAVGALEFDSSGSFSFELMRKLQQPDGVEGNRG